MADTVSSREFNQNISGAKQAATKHPVIITDRGNPSFVLMTYEHYVRLTEVKGNLVDLVGMEDGEDIEFEPVRLRGGGLRKTDLS